MKSTASIFSVMVLSASAASATQTTHECASIPRPEDRLACYDRAFGAPVARDDGASSPADFGLPENRSQKKEAAEAVTAAITAVERRGDGKFVVTLDNGQTWQQSENDSRVLVKVGDPVTVRRGALGSYLLSSKDGIATRVKRVR